MAESSVLITGAGTGIGRATAEFFSKKGFHAILLGRRPEKLLEVAQSLSGPSSTFPCDLKQPLTLAKLSELLTNVPPLHCLINNAGVYETKPFHSTTDEDWLAQFETNLFGAVRVTRIALPFLGPGASILNVSSSLGVRPVAFTSVYSATKAAMNSWTKTLALELAAQDIRVNVVCPGVVETPIHRFYGDESESGKQARAAMTAFHPLHRIGEPRQIAEALYFLHNSSWTTGTELVVDGGVSL